MAYSNYPTPQTEYECCDVCSTETLDLELLPCTHLVCVRCFEEAAVSGGSSTGCIICDSGNFPSPICHLCSPDVQAIAFCTNCSVYLCEFCEQAHVRQKRTANHRIALLESSQSNPEPREIVATRSRPTGPTLPSCPHFTPNQGHYCETCSSFICTTCKETETHHEHDIIAMNDMSLHCFEKLQNLLSKTQPLVSTLKDSVHTIRILMGTIEDKIEQTCDDVCHVIDTHIASLEEHRIMLLTELERTKTNKLNVLSHQMSTLTRALDLIHSACTETSHVLSHKNDDLPNSLLAKLSLAQKLAELTDKRYDYRPQEDDYIQFQPFTPAGRRNGYQVYGLVDTRAPSSINSTVTKETQNPSLTNEPTVLILTVYDKEGTKKTNGGDFVELRVVNPSGTVEESKVIDINNGTYKLIFNPLTPGEYKVSLLLGNRNLQGSPFIVTVSENDTTQKQHTGIYHCCSSCTTDGKMNFECQCGGHIPGKDSGCGHDFPGHPGNRHWSCCGNTSEESNCNFNTKATKTTNNDDDNN